MMKHEEMITLIGNMFINAYVAGDRKDLDSFRSARADRDRLYDAVRDLYAELEQESYNREQLQVDLNKALHKLEGLQHEYDHLIEIKDRLQIVIHDKNMKLKEYLKKRTTAFDDIPDDGIKLTDPDNPDSPLWSDYAPGPEDMEPELRDCMPFPDVENLADADAVEGSEE